MGPGRVRVGWEWAQRSSPPQVTASFIVTNIALAAPRGQAIDCTELLTLPRPALLRFPQPHAMRVGPAPQPVPYPTIPPQLSRPLFLPHAYLYVKLPAATAPVTGHITPLLGNTASRHTLHSAPTLLPRFPPSPSTFPQLLDVKISGRILKAAREQQQELDDEEAFERALGSDEEGEEGGRIDPQVGMQGCGIRVVTTCGKGFAQWGSGDEGGRIHPQVRRGRVWARGKWSKRARRAAG